MRNTWIPKMDEAEEQALNKRRALNSARLELKAQRELTERMLAHQREAMTRMFTRLQKAINGHFFEKPVTTKERSPTGQDDFGYTAPSGFDEDTPAEPTLESRPEAIASRKGSPMDEGMRRLEVIANEHQAMVTEQEAPSQDGFGAQRNEGSEMSGTLPAELSCEVKDEGRSSSELT